jgi:hypothetical protein
VCWGAHAALVLSLVKRFVFRWGWFGYGVAISGCVWREAMEVLNYLLGALGRMMLWVCSVLVLEELTLGGLARLLLSRTYDARDRRCGRAGDAAAGSAERFLAVDSKEVQGGASCSQLNTY